MYIHSKVSALKKGLQKEKLESMTILEKNAFIKHQTELYRKQIAAKLNAKFAKAAQIEAALKAKQAANSSAKAAKFEAAIQKAKEKREALAKEQNELLQKQLKNLAKKAQRKMDLEKAAAERYKDQNLDYLEKVELIREQKSVAGAENDKRQFDLLSKLESDCEKKRTKGEQYLQLSSAVLQARNKLVLAKIEEIRKSQQEAAKKAKRDYQKTQDLIFRTIIQNKDRDFLEHKKRALTGLTSIEKNALGKSMSSASLAVSIHTKDDSAAEYDFSAPLTQKPTRTRAQKILAKLAKWEQKRAEKAARLQHEIETKKEKARLKEKDVEENLQRVQRQLESKRKLVLEKQQAAKHKLAAEKLAFEKLISQKKLVLIFWFFLRNRPSKNLVRFE